MCKDEYWETDKTWLLTIFPNATENQQDAFCEKVAEMILNDNKEESYARLLCLDMLHNGLIG